MRAFTSWSLALLMAGLAACAQGGSGEGTDTGIRHDATSDGTSMGDGGDVVTMTDARDVPPADVVHDTGPMCTSTQQVCDGTCVDTQTDAHNCGACGRACPAAQMCMSGSCVCPSGQTLCGTTCVNTQTDMTNCGMCGMACSFPNASASCASGMCMQGSCTAGFFDCDGMAATGCEVNANTDVNNCGGCGMACTFANATPVCAMGHCAVGTCHTGFADCDGVPTNGCETNTDTDANNCGGCGTICTGGQVCNGGSCGCPVGDTMCGSLCVNTSTNSSNCGGCGMACPSGQMCVSGTCRINCPAPGMICGSGASMTCVNVSSDNANCGSCGHACTGGTSCSGGTCVCPAGLTLCSGTCVNTSSNNSDCGSCGHVCGAGTACSGGSCVSLGPANDTCAGAAPVALVTGTTTVTGTTVGATHDSSCGGGPDLWYSFTLSDTEAVYLDTYGSVYDTEVALYDSCSTMTTCDDDSCGVLQSQVMAVLGPGTHYAVISGFSTNSGAFTLHIQHIPVPAGSAAHGVLPAGASTQSGTNVGAPTFALSCGYMGATVWYDYLTCPSYAGGTFSASMCSGTTYDSVIQLTNGDGAGGACNDDSCGLQSVISGSSSAGAGLHIFYVSGFSTNTGNYSAAITRP